MENKIIPVSMPAKVMPANVQDRLIYAARNKISNLQNQAVLELKGRLNEEKLKQAVRLSIDAETILGSRFIEKRSRPYWQRISDLDSIEWFELEKTNHREKAITRFLTTPLDTEHQQQLKVRLIRSWERDTLCVKVSHACCDGGGLKAYQHVLAGLYSQLCKDKNYVLKPNGGGRKDQNYIFKKLGLSDLFKAWEPLHTILNPTWAFPSSPCEIKQQQLAIRRPPVKFFKALYTYAQNKGISINDLILTSFYRVLFEIIDPPPGKPKEILITVDLRRYFQDCKQNVVNNLSSAVCAKISRKPQEPFEETLTRVSVATSILKRKLPGVQVAVLFGLLTPFSYEHYLNFVRGIKNWITNTGKCSPILSNVGLISPSTIWFDQTPVVEAYQVSPAIYAPGFMLGVCTYNNRLTFTVSYYEPGTPRVIVERFMDKMLQELSLCCY